MIRLFVADLLILAPASAMILFAVFVLIVNYAYGQQYTADFSVRCVTRSLRDFIFFTRVSTCALTDRACSLKLTTIAVVVVCEHRIRNCQLLRGC